MKYFSTENLLTYISVKAYSNQALFENFIETNFEKYIKYIKFFKSIWIKLEKNIGFTQLL